MAAKGKEIRGNKLRSVERLCNNLTLLSDAKSKWCLRLDLLVDSCSSRLRLLYLLFCSSCFTVSVRKFQTTFDVLFCSPHHFANKRNLFRVFIYSSPWKTEDAVGEASLLRGDNQLEVCRPTSQIRAVLMYTNLCNS
jgi:hypothetical protein